MIASIAQYLKALKTELKGRDPATIQDALADSEEHLRNALLSIRENQPELSEGAALQRAIDQYGSPAETAAAYTEIERRTTPRLSREGPASRSLIARFFGVYADTHAWGALLYMLIAFVTGILYFTWVVTGLSLSISFAIFIFGLPFALLFLLSVRGLALLEGRMVEALLGVRMPRRPLFSDQGLKWLQRLKLLIRDKFNWLAMLYMLLQLVIGTIYFSLLVALFSLSISLMAAPFVQFFVPNPREAIANYVVGRPQYSLQMWMLPWWAGVLLVLGGILVITLTMHLSRLLGQAHGRYAKFMLVSE
jgi:Putative sensor